MHVERLKCTIELKVDLRSMLPTTEFGVKGHHPLSKLSTG